MLSRHNKLSAHFVGRSARATLINDFGKNEILRLTELVPLLKLTLLELKFYFII